MLDAPAFCCCCCCCFLFVCCLFLFFAKKGLESVCLQNYPPFQHVCIFVSKTTAYSLSQKQTLECILSTCKVPPQSACKQKCDFPVCLQTYRGNLRPALLQHSGTVVLKGLRQGGNTVALKGLRQGGNTVVLKGLRQDATQ